MKAKPKFQYMTLVGFKGDTPFTAPNRLMPPMVVIYSKWDKTYKEYEYRLQNVATPFLEHELEAR